MNRFFLLIFLLAACLSLQGEQLPANDITTTNRSTYRGRWFLELKPGYFYPTEKVLRQIFDNGGFSIRGEIDYRFWGPFAFLLDGGYFHKTGTAIGGNEKVDMTVANITLGLKGIFFLGSHFAFYGGAGPRLFSLWINNHSPYVKGHNHKIGVGAGFLGGFLIFPGTRHLFFDLFFDYSLKKMDFSPNGISSLV